MNTFPLVYILILNWNRLNDTIECLNSIFKLTYPNFRVLLIDNGSGDDPLPTILHRFPAVETLQNGKNLGFAGGFNSGIKMVLQNKATEYVWILNNDTTISPDALDILVNASQHYPQIGIVSPLIYYYAHPQKLWFSGGRLQLWRGMAENFSHQPETLDPFPCSFITGCAMLVRTDVFRAIGIFREDYFLNIEDWEFCHRATRAGYTLSVVPRSIIYHKVGLSKEGAQSYLDYYYFVRNRLFFMQDCLPLLLRCIALSVFFGHLPFWFCKLILHGDKQTIRATRDGIADFLRRKRGPRNR